MKNDLKGINWTPNVNKDKNTKGHNVFSSNDLRSLVLQDISNDD